MTCSICTQKVKNLVSLNKKQVPTAARGQSRPHGDLPGYRLAASVPAVTARKFVLVYKLPKTLTGQPFGPFGAI